MYRMLARAPKGLRPKRKTVSSLRCPYTGMLLSWYLTAKEVEFLMQALPRLLHRAGVI